MLGNSTRLVGVTLIVTLVILGGATTPVAACNKTLPCDGKDTDPKSDSPAADNPNFGSDVPPEDGQTFATRVRKAFSPGDESFPDSAFGGNENFPDSAFGGNENFPDSAFNGGENFPDSAFDERFPDSAFDGGYQDGSDPELEG